LPILAWHQKEIERATWFGPWVKRLLTIIPQDSTRASIQLCRVGGSELGIKLVKFDRETLSGGCRFHCIWFD
jgi:hypothetical protein